MSLIDTWKQAKNLKGEPHRSSQWRYASLDCPRQSTMLRNWKRVEKSFWIKSRYITADGLSVVLTVEVSGWGYIDVKICVSRKDR